MGFWHEGAHVYANVFTGVSAAEKTEIVDRHNYHRSNVNPTARDMLKMVYHNNSNSSSLCLFRAIWLAGEKVLHFDKFHDQESRNYVPSAGS